jgi:hypothetical protein
METLKKIVSNQYFPAAAVLTAVILFWAVGMLGGLSLLHNNQPPLTTLTWMLFVYMAAVLTPIAGLMAAVDLVRRWRRNRAAAESVAAESAAAATMSPEASTASTEAILVGSQRAEAHVPAEAAGQHAQQQPSSEQPAQQPPASNQPAQQQPPARKKPAPKKPIQKKQGKKAA